MKRQFKGNDDGTKRSKLLHHELTADDKWRLGQLVHSVVLYTLLAIVCNQSADILCLYAVECAQLLEHQRKSSIHLNASPPRQRKN
jgi:hypothetical protein